MIPGRPARIERLYVGREWSDRAVQSRMPLQQSIRCYITVLSFADSALPLDCVRRTATGSRVLGAIACAMLFSRKMAWHVLLPRTVSASVLDGNRYLTFSLHPTRDPIIT